MINEKFLPFLLVEAHKLTVFGSNNRVRCTKHNYFSKIVGNTPTDHRIKTIVFSSPQVDFQRFATTCESRVTSIKACQ